MGHALENEGTGTGNSVVRTLPATPACSSSLTRGECHPSVCERTNEDSCVPVAAAGLLEAALTAEGTDR